MFDFVDFRSLGFDVYVVMDDINFVGLGYGDCYVVFGYGVHSC